MVKAKLKGFTASELVSLIRGLYQTSPENRRFLRGRLLPDAADLEEYRSRVIDAVFPDPFSRKPVRVGEAERGYGDAVREITTPLTSPRAERTSSRRGSGP